MLFAYAKKVRKLLASLFITSLSLGLLANSLLINSAYAASSATPVVLSSAAGISNNTNSPPSSVIAASPKEQMELINADYSIYSSGKATSGSIASLIKTNGTFLSDPQVMWDPATSRFYFSIFENKGSSTPNEGIAWGFSKTATPSSPSDFCTYFNQFNYGANYFPDRESLGDTSNFLLIGANRYSVSTENWTGADLAWITKPPAGATCPAASSFGSGIQSLSNPSGASMAFPYVPTPAKQVDSSTTGWVAATPSYVSGDTLNLYKVTKSPTSDTAIISAPSSVDVPEYTYPPSAQQAGTTKSGQASPNLQTNVYLSEVTMANDPRFGHEDLWTANTVAGGAGDAEQWYEINPSASTLDNTGIVSSPTLDVFDGTIAPDRIVNGSVKAYGDSAIINVNTSSATSYPAIQISSVLDGAQASPLVMVKQSTGTNVDFSCFEPGIAFCRWGDYSGAVVDPASPLSGTQARIWISSEWNTPDLNDSTPTWKTQIAEIKF
jgi:hypothetical protein